MARYIREGLKWLNDPGIEVSEEDQFYTHLLWTAHEITLSFDTTPPADTAIDISEFRAITMHEIQAQINRLKDTAPGLDNR